MASSNVRCVICRQVPTRTLPIRRHVGMVFAQRFVKVRKPLCKEHGMQMTAAFLGRTMVQGWWGFVSFFVNIVVVLGDVGVWVAYRTLADPRPAPNASPMSSALMALAGVRPDTSPGEWRTDLYMRHQYRWFSGTAWTEHVSDDGLVTFDPPGWKRREFA